MLDFIIQNVRDTNFIAINSLGEVYPNNKLWFGVMYNPLYFPHSIVSGLLYIHLWCLLNKISG